MNFALFAATTGFLAAALLFLLQLQQSNTFAFCLGNQARLLFQRINARHLL